MTNKEYFKVGSSYLIEGKERKLNFIGINGLTLDLHFEELPLINVIADKEVEL